MKALILCACAMLSACAPVPYRPVVDTGTPRGNYEDDLADCQRFAEQRPVADNAAGGAVAGAIFGALIGAAFGLHGSNLGQVAAAGAVSGGARGAGNAAAAQQTIVANCMAHRGYAVLSP
jgi:uncharacterized protein YcfJ